MSRPRSHRLRINGTLTAVSPLHVGGMGDSLETDMPLARDGTGRAYVPGTALAGPLREWTRRHFPRQVDDLWGFQRADDGHASRVLVEDCPVVSAIPEEIWDSLGIDREWGAAATGVKFDRAVLPAGTTLRFEMAVELPENASEAAAARAVLGHLLVALQTGEVGLGAAGTRGLGRVRLTCTVGEEDWSSPDGVLAFLAGRTRGDIMPGDLLAAAPGVQPAPSPSVQITIEWAPAGPLMGKAPYDGVAVDTLPFVSACGAGEMAMALPGASIKGVLRAQAERIVRTVLGTTASAWPADRDRRRHPQQVDEPLVRHLFGSAGGGTDDDAGRGALAVDTCYAATARLRRDAWAALARAKSAEAEAPGGRSPLSERLDAVGLLERQPDAPYFEQAFHVAVDRWTGSAADGLLYSALEPFNVAWEPLRLRLDIAALRRCGHQAALALLLMLIRDLARDRIPLGFGTNRGYGSIAVGRVHMKAAGADVEWLDGVVLEGGALAGLSQARLVELETAWREWISRQAREAS